ncbi:hypothetical protein [Leptospira sp. GIMC2001]|uniref:hypothetical protein n=1 Tax=Leptospira sp. GIMC2001 TaxID=1513297 RepID=UPI00234B993E|nr:hypothetical protein [Leptospira sp. GIMC2001]WCL50003.1 hypothetical protein O4O04_04070 [Leptospira sp. GIMC2001]
MTGSNSKIRLVEINETGDSKMRKVFLIPGMLFLLAGVTNCKSLISVADGQTKGKTYASIYQPSIFTPSRGYIAQCTHEGSKFTCGEEISVSLK